MGGYRREPPKAMASRHILCRPGCIMFYYVFIYNHFTLKVIQYQFLLRLPDFYIRIYIYVCTVATKM